MTSSKANQLQKILPPNIITWGLAFQHKNLSKFKYAPHNMDLRTLSYFRNIENFYKQY